MSQSKAGAIKARNTLKEKYGADYYVNMGRAGGLVKGVKGFALNRELARTAGAKGGAKSKRSKR
jgi:general stress protein YciG